MERLDFLVLGWIWGVGRRLTPALKSHRWIHCWIVFSPESTRQFCRMEIIFFARKKDNSQNLKNIIPKIFPHAFENNCFWVSFLRKKHRDGVTCHFGFHFGRFGCICPTLHAWLGLAKMFQLKAQGLGLKISRLGCGG